MTKLTVNSHFSNLPAGLVDDTELELFGRNPNSKQMYAIHNGKTTRFEDLPLDERLPFINAGLADGKRRALLRKQFNLVGFETEFRQWLWCMFGGLDTVADRKNGIITPDSFNNLCKDYNCPLRGKVCRVPSRLRTHEVLTLVYVVNGFSISDMSREMFIGIPTVKSRIQKLKNKMNARNIAQLSAKAVQMGITA